MGQASRTQLNLEMAMAVLVVCGKLLQEALGTLKSIPKCFTRVHFKRIPHLELLMESIFYHPPSWPYMLHTHSVQLTQATFTSGISWGEREQRDELLL